MPSAPLIDRYDLDRADSYYPDPVDLDLTLRMEAFAAMVPKCRRWPQILIGLAVLIGLAILGTVHLWAPYVDGLFWY